MMLLLLVVVALAAVMMMKKHGKSRRVIQLSEVTHSLSRTRNSQLLLV
jgi:hypothetical protein